MWLQVALLTGCLLCFGLSAWCVSRATRAWEGCSRSEARLTYLRAKVQGLDLAVEKLDAQHRKLAGRVYADQYWRNQDDVQPDLIPDNGPGPFARADADLAPFLKTPCENWTTAQQLGPTSEAAKCDCTYCSARRVQRERTRAAVIPKTAHGQSELAKLNASKP